MKTRITAALAAALWLPLVSLAQTAPQIPSSAEFMGTRVAINTAFGQLAPIPCSAAPGNTAGVYGQQCQTTLGARYSCNNSAGCAVAGDWVSGASGTLSALGYAFGYPAVGKAAYLTVPWACTIQAWDMAVNSGAATVDVWRAATGTSVPTVAGSITASAQPAISSGTALHSANLTGWATAIHAGDILGYNPMALSGGLTGAVYGSGITATGSTGQTCALTGFNGGGSAATATVALTGTNAIANGTALTVTGAGTGYTSSPSTATAGNGTATCSGTASLYNATTSVPTYLSFILECQR